MRCGLISSGHADLCGWDFTVDSGVARTAPHWRSNNSLPIAPVDNNTCLPPISLHYLAIGLPVLLFFLWRPGFFRGESMVPRRSYVLLAIVTVLSILYFISSWRLGLRYQGVGHTHAVLVVNVGWAAVLVWAFVRTRKTGASFRTSLFVHWMLFAWYAFPYLGELT